MFRTRLVIFVAAFALGLSATPVTQAHPQKAERAAKEATQKGAKKFKVTPLYTIHK